MKSACRKALLLAVLPFALTACFKTSTEIGKDLIDQSLLYDTYTVEFPIEDIRLRRADDLSGFSDKRLAIGAIRDETFGLTTRSTAFCLVPALDTLDLGTDPEFVRFMVHFEADTISTAHKGQEHILQNLFVYSLTDTLSSKKSGTNRIVPHGGEIVTRGIPVYDGEDSLSFEFNREYGQKYVDVLKRLGPVLASRDEIETINKYKEYIQEVPGIYIESDVPEGIGGRINLFELSCLSVSNNYYYRNENVGRLTVRSTYNGVRKDTTFLFIPGEPTLYDEAEYLESNKQFYQYVFNRTGHEAPEAHAEGEIRIEGGGGLKPVIPAAQLRSKVVDAIVQRGGDPAKTVINKASLILPYEAPADEDLVTLFPPIISPTIRKTDKEGTVTFAGLTDASASSENQGNLDRANRAYAPDITYHMQQLLQRKDLDTKDDADIWFLTVHSETVANANGNAEQEAYYQQMMYAMYYNNLYGGGYGGYGGYGYGGYGYGYGGYGGYGGYSNYYNMMMMSSLLNSMNQTTYTTTQELDKDRYYRAILNGPASTATNPASCLLLLPGAKRVPTFRVTFSVPKG